MSHLLFIDGHNILFRCLHASMKYKSDGTLMKKEDMAIETKFTGFKDAVMQSIYGMIKHFKPTDVIWAVDFGKSWRYDLFPEYKKSRRDKRDEDSINFEAWKAVCNEFFPHLMYALPNIRFIHADRAEGDDVIAVGIMDFGGDYTKISIVSSDEDLLQTHTNSKITQWKYDSKTNKYDQVKTDDPVMSREVKIISGDKSDDIPNMRVGTAEAGAVKLLNEGFDSWADAQATKDVIKYLKDNPGFPDTDEFRTVKKAELIESWKVQREFNRALIDFRMIPEWMKDRIRRAIMDYRVSPMPVADPQVEANLFNFFKYHSTMRAMEEWDSVALYFAAINRG